MEISGGRTPHPVQRRLWVEELVRLRRARERERYAASQRRGRIDPNPHQIDAVIFALERIPEGGCILADEVGLGKTIEAGLILAQLMAEGMRRILVIVPKPLLGQWQNELYTLFGLETREGGGDPRAFEGAGVFLVGREFAGSERGADVLARSEPFELCVIDEAHEIFAGIHKRYDRDGNYRDDASEALIAHRVMSVLGGVPKLLLTATPIQNSLIELWGLVQYVEPTGTLLGDLPTFREVFCDGHDRSLATNQTHELRQRIGQIVKRTLRRQAQEFLERPFVARRAMLFEYAMSEEERALYDDVTRYLLEPNLCAFRGRQRQLLLIGFHRRMASSLSALTASLRKVAERLEGMRAGRDVAAEVASDFSGDLESEDLPEPDASDAPAPAAADVAAELERVRGFVRRAESIRGDGKADRLIEAVMMIRERGESGEGSGKAVVFTESLTTQAYLRERLLAAGLSEDEITLFRGTNDSPRALAALEAWRAEVGEKLPVDARPSADVAVRLALVHEFKTRSAVFVSTEAGAKGLNLQFCDTIINYDLPWNPQRIEQRIGRCHRYSQTRDVTVINFSARDNEAQRLTLDILMSKLDLFGQVLDASDVVLHEPATDAPELLVGALGAEFHSRLARIYERARTIEEIEEELRALRDAVGDRRKEFEDALARTHGIIESRFDDTVRRSFRSIQDELPVSLAELDQRLDRVVAGYLDAEALGYERRKADDRIYYEISPAPRLPEEMRAGARFAIGRAKGLEDVEPLHLGHPLVRAAIAEARAASEGIGAVSLTVPAEAPSSLAARRGQRGRLVVLKLRYDGFEPVEHIYPVAVFEGDDGPVAAEVARTLLACTPADLEELSPPLAIDDAMIDDAIDEAVFLDQAGSAEVEQKRFEQAIERIERYVDDRVLVLRRRETRAEERLARTQARRDAALGAEARADADRAIERIEKELDELQSEIRRLETRRDESYERWRSSAHRRRYATPGVERILDLEFAVA